LAVSALRMFTALRIAEVKSYINTRSITFYKMEMKHQKG